MRLPPITGEDLADEFFPCWTSCPRVILHRQLNRREVIRRMRVQCPRVNVQQPVEHTHYVKFGHVPHHGRIGLDISRNLFGLMARPLRRRSQALQDLLHLLPDEQCTVFAVTPSPKDVESSAGVSGKTMAARDGVGNLVYANVVFWFFFPEADAAK